MNSPTQNVIDEILPEFKLPGFRFHPTEEELLEFYLKNMILGKAIHYDIIPFLNIYHYHPQELPGKAKIGEREWYFYVPRDRKHGSGGRPNRTTESGFWKATGSDRKIVSLSEPKRVIGLRKTLVFYKGRAPGGKKTDWVMNEYRFPDNSKLSKDIVLCKVYMKATSLKVLEQRVAMEEGLRSFHGTNNNNNNSVSLTSTMESGFSLTGLAQEDLAQISGLQEEAQIQIMDMKQEFEDVFDDVRGGSSKGLQLPNGYKEKLADIQVPSKLGLDWSTNQDPLWMQLNSPWLQSLTPFYYDNNILNF